MCRGVGVQAQTQQSQQPQYQPQPPQEPSYQPQPQKATKPSKSGSVRKAVAVIVVLVILVAILYVVFVPKVIEREEVREAKYEIVSENKDIRDEYECIRWSGWIFVTCDEYAWIRYVSYSITIRALKEEGDLQTNGSYVVSIEVVSGLNLSGETDQRHHFVYENNVRTFHFSFPSFAISQDDHQHNTAYDIDRTISAPKTVVKEKITIFESLF
jgi:hypothetical protein